MSTSSTINDISKLEEKINKKIPKEEKKYWETFFRTKFVRIENRKITYPKKKDINEIIKETQKMIDDKKKEHKFWEKEKTSAENYYKINSFKKNFKKIYWKHKLRMATDAEYKKDVEKARLSEETLTDPKYEALLDTFLIDSEYRKKLGETVSTSVVYKNFNVGDANKKKQDFKKETAIKKIEQLNKIIINLKHKINTNKTILKYVS